MIRTGYVPTDFVASLRPKGACCAVRVKTHVMMMLLLMMIAVCQPIEFVRKFTCSELASDLGTFASALRMRWRHWLLRHMPLVWWSWERHNCFSSWAPIPISGEATPSTISRRCLVSGVSPRRTMRLQLFSSPRASALPRSLLGVLVRILSPRWRLRWPNRLQAVDAAFRHPWVTLRELTERRWSGEAVPQDVELRDRSFFCLDISAPWRFRRFLVCHVSPECCAIRLGDTIVSRHVTRCSRRPL